jgi:hypothetical protein
MDKGKCHKKIHVSSYPRIHVTAEYGQQIIIHTAHILAHIHVFPLRNFGAK